MVRARLIEIVYVGGWKQAAAGWAAADTIIIPLINKMQSRRMQILPLTSSFICIVDGCGCLWPDKSVIRHQWVLPDRG